MYHLDCKNRPWLPKLMLTLAAHNFTISADDYVIDLQGTCISAFTGIDMADAHGPLAILSTPFLRRRYSVYDMGRSTIGLARARRILGTE